MQAEWSDNGFTAISLIETAKKRGDPFNVCLIDWKMPHMDGMETARHIRKIAGGDISIILITANDSTNIEQEATEIGVSGVIVNPLFESTIADALSNIR